MLIHSFCTHGDSSQRRSRAFPLTNGSSFSCLEAVCNMNPLLSDSTQRCMTIDSTAETRTSYQPPAALTPCLVLTSLVHLPDFPRKKIVCKLQLRHQNSILPRKQGIKRPRRFTFILEQALEIEWSLDADLSISSIKSPTCTEHLSVSL